MDSGDALLFFDNDNDNFSKSARKLSSEKQKGLTKTFPEPCGESQVVFTEMGEFLSGLHQFDKLEKQKSPSVKEEERYMKEEKSVVSPDKMIREVPIGKGLSETLRLLRERGSLKGGDVELGGRITDKKNSRLVGVGSDEKGKKEIHVDRIGRSRSPKEAFRLFSHQFHGKRPGKKKREKRMWDSITV